MSIEPAASSTPPKVPAAAGTPRTATRGPRRPGSNGRRPPSVRRRRSRTSASVLLETVVGHHPQADLTLRRRRLRPRRRGPRRPAPRLGRAVRHPPDRLGPDPGRPRHRPGRRPGGAPPRRPGGHRVQPRPTSRSASAPEVARLVDGVTKLSKFSTHTHEQQQAENIRKMFLAMAEDIRVVLIKLADRLHNMRTLGALPIEKQQRIARQTMEIYAPLAERLGIWQMKWELEDLAFKALEPERFRELARLLDTRRKGRETFIERAIDELRPSSRRPASRPTSRAGRSTSTASGRRCSARAPSSARSTTSTRSASSSTRSRTATPPSGIVHSLWRPIPGQFDDYIAVPKNNLYQSLHTAVIALDGKPLEIQIRTHAMHQVSRGRHRRPLALQGRLQGRPRVRRQARLAAPAHGLAARRRRRDRVRRGHQARHLPGPGLRLHAEGRRQGPAGRRDAARLRLPDPHRRRPPRDRGQGQQPARAARLPAQERRHRRDRHDQGRARPVARLAEHRPDEPRPGEDPAMVQAPGARREHRPRPRVARARAPPARPDESIEAVGLDRIVEIARRYNYDTLDDFYAAIGYGAVGAQQVVMRLGVVDDAELRAADRRSAQPIPSGPAASGSRASATCSSASASAAIRSRATRSSASSPGARASPSTSRPARRSSTSARSAASSRSSGRPRPPRPTRSRSASRPTTGPGLLSDITQVVAENKVNIVAASVNVTPDHTATVTRHAPGRLGRPARPGDEPDRAAQGRHLGPARPRLTRVRPPARKDEAPTMSGPRWRREVMGGSGPPGGHWAFMPQRE